LLAEVGDDATPLGAYAWYCAGEADLAADRARARRRYERAVELARRTGAAFVTGLAGAAAASIDARDGDPDAAARAFRGLIDHWRRAGMWATQWTMLRAIAGLLARQGSTRTPPCWSAPSGPPTPGTASSGPTRRRSTSSTGSCGPCSVTRPTRPRAPAARGSTAMPPPSSRAGPCDTSPHASPARLLREDPEGGLADQLVGQRVVRRVEAAAADVAVEPLELVALEHPGAAGHVEGDV